MDAPESSRSIRVLVRHDDDGETWLGVGVCLDCQPGGEVRRTFSAGGTCPQCGAPGTLEWRWWPDVVPYPAEQAAGPARRTAGGAQRMPDLTREMRAGVAPLSVRTPC